jgi:hypothetical protein
VQPLFELPLGQAAVPAPSGTATTSARKLLAAIDSLPELGIVVIVPLTLQVAFEEMQPR